MVDVAIVEAAAAGIALQCTSREVREEVAASYRVVVQVSAIVEIAEAVAHFVTGNVAVAVGGLVVSVFSLVVGRFQDVGIDPFQPPMDGVGVIQALHLVLA